MSFLSSFRRKPESSQKKNLDTSFRRYNGCAHIGLLVICFCIPLTACGHKGKLKTPSQIELEEQKKARKEAKKAEEEQKKKNPSPLAVEGKDGGGLKSGDTPPPNLLPQGEEE